MNREAGIYYKAVRPDGTDFYTETVDYAALCGTGEGLPAKPVVDDPRCCSGDVYHASTSKADTLIGGSWPCRLFEVEGEEVAQEENKRGFYTLKVVHELPAHEALGPNGEAVAALIEKASTLTAEQIRNVSLAQDAAQDAAWYAARDAAWYAARDAAWYAVRDAARDAAWYEAWYAAWYAVLALVIKDLISEEHFNLLYGPWCSVMGEAE